MRQRGFTLIEMTIVITILALTAALIVPRVSAIKDSRAFHDQEAAIIRLPREARNEARRSGQPVTLRVSSNTLVIERTPSQDSSQVVKQLSLGSSFVVNRAQKGSEDTDISSWTWVAYPDGSSDKGGLEFTAGGKAKYLLLPSQGNALWDDGNLPPSAQERWKAGELQQRG